MRNNTNVTLLRRITGFRQENQEDTGQRETERGKRMAFAILCETFAMKAKAMLQLTRRNGTRVFCELKETLCWTSNLIRLCGTPRQPGKWDSNEGQWSCALAQVPVQQLTYSWKLFMDCEMRTYYCTEMDSSQDIFGHSLWRRKQ